MPEISEETFRDYPKLIETLNKAHYSLLVIGTKISAESVRHQSKKFSMMMFLYSDIVETIESCIKLCQNGYYGSTAKLLRNCFEGAFFLKKLNSYPEEAFEIDHNLIKDAFDGKDIMKSRQIYKSLDSKQKQKFEVNLWADLNREANRSKIIMFMSIFKPSELIQKFSESENITEYLKTYHILSQFSHPSLFGVLHRIKEDENWVLTRPLYNKNYAKENLKDIFKTIVLCKNFISQIFPDLTFSQEEMDILEDVEKRYNELV